VRANGGFAGNIGTAVMTDAEFERFAHACEDELRQKQERIAELLLFGFEVDFPSLRIRYTADGALFVEAGFVPIGSRGLRSNTWLWAWANPGTAILDPDAAKRIEQLGLKIGRPAFASAQPFAATEADAWRYAAIACHELEGAGIARVTANDSDWFLLVRWLRHERPEADLVARAETAVHESLLAARGPGLLNIMRRRFPGMRLSLIDADLRGAANPWAHDLHVQLLAEYADEMVKSSQAVHPGEPAPEEFFASRRRHDLDGANLSVVRLDGAILRGVSLRNASLEGASLVDADLSRADLRGTSLRDAFLNGANLTGAALAGADIAGAELSRTLLADVDLSRVRGLDQVQHAGPSEIGMSTLVASDFNFDPAFLRRAGVSRGLIEDLERGQRFAGAYETCFLSYSSADREFALQLYTALTGAGVRVFWDYFDVVPGESLDQQIAQAIRELKRLIVVLSPASLKSEWVAREIRLAQLHRPESLLPIRLCPIEDVKAWSSAHPDLPKIADALPIQDFSDWRTPAPFEHALELLLKGLGGTGAPRVVGT
jgi:uncharacterized protein YjbI with pentapeptide repeats